MLTLKLKPSGTITVAPTHYLTPLGDITLLWEYTPGKEPKLLALWFKDMVPKPFTPYQAQIMAQAVEPALIKTRSVQQAIAWLDTYFQGKIPATPLPPLKLYGSAFEQKVWQELLTIAPGTVTTYGALAHKLFPEKGTLMARAIGQAVGHNPIAIMVPCHRVLGANGTLTGYAYGLADKQYLLKLEDKMRR